MSDTARGSRAGSRFGRYHLKRLLGRGGMGEVYEAEDTVKERVVALKLLSEALCQDPVFRERLQREARTAGRLQEPHVVPVHDYGEIDGQLFLDMRLIEGTDLSALLKRFGVLTPPRAVAIVRQVASALDAAHAAGVIHRDVKPENILITRDDFAYLVDFGIADAATDDRLTGIGHAVGTWKYTAPERFTNAEVSHGVDVYSLTCVLHECLTGSPPYRADSAGMLITAHLMAPIPSPSQLRPGVSSAFDAVIARGMAKDPQERYASAGDLGLAAYEALSAPDQDRAGDIVERSEKSTLPNTAVELPPTRIAYSPPSVPMAHPPASPSSHDPTGSRSLPHPPPSPPVGPTSALGSGRTQRPSGGPRAVPPFAPGGGARPGGFRTPPAAFRRPRPAPRKPKPKLLLGAAVLGVLAVLVGVVIRLLHPSQPTLTAPSTTRTTSAAATPTTPASTLPTAEAQARLFSVLPAGYPPDTCKLITPPKGALATVSCDKNADPDGPPSATYTLFPDKARLRGAFNGIVQTSTVVDCPGRIQSPGPWHRNATPDKTSGMLLCGTQRGNPTVVWTNDAELLISVVQAKQKGPTLDQLFAWWTSHS